MLLAVRRHRSDDLVALAHRKLREDMKSGEAAAILIWLRCVEENALIEKCLHEFATLPYQNARYLLTASSVLDEEARRPLYGRIPVGLKGTGRRAERHCNEDGLPFAVRESTDLLTSSTRSAAMIDQPSRLLLFMKDFTGRGADAFYWFQDGHLQETEANSVVEFPGIVICHDFWMIRDALLDRTGTLPGKIIDVDEFRISISGIPEDRLAREKRDVTTQIGQYGAEQEVRNTYQKMFNKGVPFDAAVVAKAAAAISAMYADLCAQASANGEFDRFFSVEVPAYRLLQLSMSSGVLIDTSGLSDERAQAEHDYFLLLKDYSAKHDMPLETPTRRAIEARLLKEGFVLDEVSVEYLLEFVPHERDFGSDTMALLALRHRAESAGLADLVHRQCAPGRGRVRVAHLARETAQSQSPKHTETISIDHHRAR